MEPLVGLAFLALAAGVVGSFLPVVPSGLLSVLGVLLYWLQTGQPGPFVLVTLLAVGLLATLVDWFAGAIGAGAGGASTRSVLAATVVGVLLLVPAGPVGLVVGVVGTVFALELLGGRSGEASLRAAGYALVGIVSSAVVQALLTATVLVAMVAVALCA
ncbi:MAG: DUF456 family protein [Halanaeroarchaeum sp.]